jgi:hypothetical protein
MYTVSLFVSRCLYFALSRLARSMEHRFDERCTCLPLLLSICIRLQSWAPHALGEAQLNLQGKGSGARHPNAFLNQQSCDGFRSTLLAYFCRPAAFEHWSQQRRTHVIRMLIRSH